MPIHISATKEEQSEGKISALWTGSKYQEDVEQRSLRSQNLHRIIATVLHRRYDNSSRESEAGDIQRKGGVVP